MLELAGRKENLILAPPAIPAPGVWTPESRVPVAGLGALVTPLLGWHWDSEPAPFQQYPGALVWTSPSRQIERFFRRLHHIRPELPFIAALAPDEPAALSDAAEVAEVNGARAVLLWDAPEPAHVSAVTATTLLPVIVEYPAGTDVPHLRTAEALLVGPPRVRLDDRTARVWGPAIQPLVREAAESHQERDYPVLVTGSITDGDRTSFLDDAGVDGLCIGPELWVTPDILVE